MLKSQFAILAAVTVSSLAFTAPARAQWTDVGATAKGFNSYFRPAVTRTDDGSTEHVEVYAIEAGTNQVLQKEFDITHNTQTAWNALGVPPGTTGVVASPTAVAWNGRREAYVIGSDRNLYRLYSINGGAFTWQQLGPGNQPLCADPSAASWGPGRVDIFSSGCNDGNLWHVACANNGCNWESRAAASQIAGVAAAAYAGARLDVWVSEINSSFDYDLVDFQYNGSGWNIWKPGVTGGWFVFAGTPTPSVSNNTTNSGFNVTTVGTKGELWGAGGTTGVDPTVMNKSDPANQYPGIPALAQPAIANEDSFGEIYLRDPSHRMIRWEATWSQKNGINPGIFQFLSQRLDTSDTFASDPGVVALDGPTSNRPIRVFAVQTNGHMYMGSDTAQ
jgi:hypothetical protein